MSTILAIESSCDETAAAVCINGEIKSNIVITQHIHEKYGGVVPELASRVHQQNIIPVVDAALKHAKIDKADLSAIAYTRGPGLLGALLVGSSFAKSMALVLNIPLLEVHHMHAHILAHFIGMDTPTFPFLCLTVSGGHTQIVKVTNFFDLEIIGETQDDAVGEAFDKTAKLLQLPYPGGPILDKIAKEGNPLKFKFAEADIPDLDFSFSGTKTSFLYFVQNQMQKEPEFIQNNLADLCASIQHCLVETLLKKLKKAAKIHSISEIAIAGGVSANSYLRKCLQEMSIQNKWKIYIPDFQYCTDNAAMVAITAHYQYINKKFGSQSHGSLPRWQLKDI